MLDVKRIKEEINEHPWRCSLFYPGAFFTSILVLSTYLTKFHDSFGIIYLLSFLCPLWLLLGATISSRKFPYIITFVIFIGLPLLAIFAKTGYERAVVLAAKSNATETLHRNVAKYIYQEIEKCNTGSSKIIEDKFNCSSLNSKEIISAMLKVNKISEYVELNSYKNAFQHNFKPLRLSTKDTTDADVGFVNLSTSNSRINIKTCIKTPCKNEENRLQTSIKIE